MNKVLYSPTQAWTHFTVGIFIVAASMMAGRHLFPRSDILRQGLLCHVRHHAGACLRDADQNPA